MKNKVFAFCCLLIGLAGCAKQIPVPLTPASDNASIKIAEAADSVSNSLVELARIQAEATPPVRELPDPVTYGIRGAASVDWAGPIGPLVKKLARASQFHYRVLGRPPAVPIIVNVSAKSAPLASLLRDVDFQAGNKADVVILAHARVIELRYAKS